MYQIFICVYSLVKMVYGFAKQAKLGNLVSDVELEQCIRRNFSGLDDLDPMTIFSRQFLKLRKKIMVSTYTTRKIFSSCTFSDVIECKYQSNH